MITLRDGAFLFTGRYFIVIVTIIIISTHERTPRALYTKTRAHTVRTPLLCTYVSNNGPKHPSFYIVISKHESKFIHYRTSEAATDVIILYEDGERYTRRIRTHMSVQNKHNDLTFDRFRFLRFHSMRQPLAWHLFGGGYGPLGRLTFYRGFFLVPVRHAQSKIILNTDNQQTVHNFIYRARLS